jgi:hypothetical protein
MENKNPFRLTVRVLLFIVTTVTFLLPGCKTGALKDQVMMLSEKQTSLANERDSLQRLLEIKTLEVNAINKSYDTLNSDFNTLTIKNKSLLSGYYTRGEQLKKAIKENSEMSNSADYLSAKNDSLQNELRYLQEKIAAIDKEMADAQSNNTTLALTVKEQEEKILADSIAEANKPVPPVYIKQSGFVSITEIGGGFGIGDVAADYSRSLISINTVAGYRINSHFLTGIGTGVHFYNGGTLIPLYLDLRYTFKDSKFTPFVVADGGMLFNIKDFITSGLFINPRFGLEKKLNARVSLNMSTGVLLKQSPVGYRTTFINFMGGVSFRAK